MSYNDTPPPWAKYTFWFTIGAISTFFAEVVTASTPLPFFTGSGLVVTYPFYTLSVVVFSYIAFKKPRVDVYTLYLAGQLMGLFEESYATKMLWSPGWGAEPKLLGVSLIPFILLVFLWHPIMSFIVPLLIGETALTESRETVSSLPDRVLRLMQGRSLYLTFVFFALFCGINEAVNSPSRALSFISVTGSWAVVLLLSYFYKKLWGRGGIRELMLTRREFSVALMMLISLYVLITTNLFPEGLPPLHEQVGIWLAYIILGILMYLELRTPPLKSRVVPFQFPWKLFVAFGPVVAVFAALLPRSISLVVAPWIVGVGVGVYVFLGALRRIIKEILLKPSGTSR